MSYDNKYIYWYATQNYDRINLLLPKGSKARIKAEAEKDGKTISEYIKGCLPDRLLCEREFVRKRDVENVCTGNE